MWFEANYMKVNEDKCHFLSAKVGDEIIWESNHEKLFGIIINKKLNSSKHLEIICKKVGAKVDRFVWNDYNYSFREEEIVNESIY